MELTQQAGTEQELLGVLSDLKSRLVAGLNTEKPDYLELADIKRQYELNVNNNISVLRRVSREAEQYKAINPDLYERVSDVMPAAVQTQLGSRYNFDRQEKTAPWYQANFGLPDSMAQSLEIASSRPADATPEDVSLLNRFNTILRNAPDNNADVKMHMMEYDSLRKDPRALAGLNDYTASKIFEAREAAGGGISIPELRDIFDPLKRAFVGKGDSSDPEAGNRMAADALASAVKVAGPDNAAYVLSGLQMALEANPIPEGGAAQMRVLIRKATNFAMTDTSTATANRIAQETGLSEGERRELVKNANTVALARSGLADINSPAVTAARGYINARYPSLRIDNGMADAINQTGKTGLAGNVARAWGKKPEDIPAPVNTLIDTATEQATTVAQLDRKVRATGISPATLKAFSDEGAADGQYSRAQLIAQKEILTGSKGVLKDPVLKETLEEHLALLDARLGDEQTQKYKTVEEAKAKLARKAGNLSPTELDTASIALRDGIEEGLMQVYHESTGTFKNLFLMGIGPDSGARADALRDEALNKITVDIGGKPVPMRALMPYLKNVPFADESGRAQYGGSVTSFAGIREHVKAVSRELVDSILTSGSASIDPVTRKLALTSVRTGTGTAGKDYTVEGQDITTPAGGAALFAKYSADPRLVGVFTDYSTWSKANRQLDSTVNDIGKITGMPGFTRETLLTGRTGADSEAVTEASSRINSLLLGTGGTSAERLADSQANLNNARGKAIIAQTRLNEQLAGLKREALTLSTAFKDKKLDLDTYKARITANHYAQLDAKTRAQAYQIQQNTGAPAEAVSPAEQGAPVSP